ncbi:MAG: DoxX family protein [Segetibacter sp.]|nr:DoxX family protein [Segetibacter sp.]
MLSHGLPKLSKFMAGNIQFADPIGLGAGVSLGLAVFAEAICSMLIIVGLGTRFAVIPLIITMMVATFISHAADPFAKKELAVLYILIYITLAVTGPGAFSIDALISKKKKHRSYK